MRGAKSKLFNGFVRFELNEYFVAAGNHLLRPLTATKTTDPIGTDIAPVININVIIIAFWLAFQVELVKHLLLTFKVRKKKP